MLKPHLLLDFIISSSCLGKLQKKVLLLMARPLRGGGSKGPAIKEKRTFLELFKQICCHLKIKIIFTLDNL